jgi:amino acid transporter
MGAAVESRPTPPERTGNLGTFAGVFTPSVLTILGIILFLRLSYVLGNAGLGRALLIIALANAISVLTSISLSAIATNLRVKGGGDYYLISRTLGVEFGGAIGIVLFLAQSVSIAFYCIGFGEALSGILPGGAYGSPRFIATLAVAFLFVFAWLGADWATRFQYVVMTLLAAALFSFFAGGLARWDATLIGSNWISPEGTEFWLLFAIFFPAVTGFTQGVSMSGDLKDPGTSLPMGTFCAVGISIVVYFGVAVVLAGALPVGTLAKDYASMKRVALFGPLIDAGVIAATLSSAMASYLGAPRILQSLSADRIFSFLRPFAVGSGATNNPRRGVLVSTGIAFLTIGMGNLNVIAPIVSMFFLISYGLLNYATFYEARSSSPSFRPKFRLFHPRLSLIGFLCCLGSMLAIDLAAGVIAVSVLFAIYQYLRRTSGPARWADSRRSFHLQQIRSHLIAASAEPEHPRDWRPQILAFTEGPSRRRQLLQFASWIQGRSGLTTAVRMIEGEGLKGVKMREEAEAALRSEIEKNNLNAFPLVVSASDFRASGSTLIQSFGLGPLKANTILVNCLKEFPSGIRGVHEASYGFHLRTAFRFGCNVVILDPKEEAWARLKDTPLEQRRIDVWWWGDSTSQLMLLLAYLMKRNDDWSEALIRVIAPATEKSEEDHRLALEEARIEAELLVMQGASLDDMVKSSEDSAVVFLPFRLRGDRLIGPFDTEFKDLLPHMPVTALVLAARQVDLDAEPEEGRAGEMASASDALEDARRKVEEAEKEAMRAAEAVKKAEKRMEDLISQAGPGADRETMEKIEKQVKEVEETKREAEKAVRREATKKAKAEEAATAAEALGVKLDEEKDE